MRFSHGCMWGRVPLLFGWYFGWAIARDFFSFYVETTRAIYEVQWFRGQGLRAFSLPFGEYRLTLDGQVTAWRLSQVR